MERTSVEDFQTYHGRCSDTLSNGFPSRSGLQHSPIHSIEHDYDDAASLSGSAHHSNGPDEAIFDGPLSHRSSPRTSHHSDDNESISSLFSAPPDHQPSSPYTSLKMRSPFRNPSSVRAMQMETTPPPYIPSSQSRPRSTFPTPSRNGTPKSVRSVHSGICMSPSKMLPTKKANVQKEYPLVLLHVTLLPVSQMYSAEVMDHVLSSYILKNWKVLREKATDTVLERGILIPHPKEDYDLLEERLLESLDLKTPRILKCGHFHLDPEEEADATGSDADCEDEDNDADICDDCGRRVRDGIYGSGTGSQRWDIKVYAANGLMRAGAWEAAWREMERVDVEIIPWMDEEVKRELALRTEEERKHAALLQEEIVGRVGQRAKMDEERMREIYGDDIPGPADSQAEQAPSLQPKHAAYRRQNEIPLQDLLQSYLIAAAQDRKNIAIFVLTIFVLYLSMAWRPQVQTPAAEVLRQSAMTSSAPIISIAAAPLMTSMSSAAISESSVAQASGTPNVSTASREDVEVSPSPVPASSSEGTVDSIEAQFEFAGE
ncbi:MAG: hypothetical protein Q9166_007517 [cf. Caloplaca sp. 2 TL-2023]